MSLEVLLLALPSKLVSIDSFGDWEARAAVVGRLDSGAVAAFVLVDGAWVSVSPADVIDGARALSKTAFYARFPEVGNNIKILTVEDEFDYYEAQRELDDAVHGSVAKQAKSSSAKRTQKGQSPTRFSVPPNGSRLALIVMNLMSGRFS
jgi:hypothetical protein